MKPYLTILHLFVTLLMSSTFATLLMSSTGVAMDDIDQPKIQWKYQAEGAVRGTAAIYKHAVYFGSSDGYVYAVDKYSGDHLWEYKTGGAIVSSPEIHNDVLYISSRDQYLYAIDSETGERLWKFKMQEILPDERPGWMYFMASPVVVEENVLIGSGDGNLYAVNKDTGELDWSFQTKGRIRATPLVHNKKIYQPSNDGYVYIFDLEGRLEWKFETLGATYNQEEFNFDRTSIIAQPKIHENTLIIASRDGHVYGIDLISRSKIWDFSYGNTWAMSTTISGDSVFVGWSTNDHFSVLNIADGIEQWKYITGSHNFPAALVSENSAYITSSDGKIYRLNKATGEKTWEYLIGDEIYSSPVYDAETKAILLGSDDGYLYSISEGQEAYKAVYHPFDDRNRLRNPKASNAIAPYLSEQGFQHISTEADLYQFIENRIQDKMPSVVVFAHLVIPQNVLGEDSGQGLMRKYLESGGKVLWPGDVPNLYERDQNGNPILSKIPGSNLLSVEFHERSSGIYQSRATKEGRNFGIPELVKTYSTNIDLSEQITPLAYNEFGEISIWMKKFHPRLGSGYISFRTWGANTQPRNQDLDLLYQIAVYGLE